MSGWIKIHRTITEHWLYTEKRVFSKFEAWNDILLTVNYTETKCLIKGKLYTVKRGQSVLSLDNWGKRWGWDKSKVRRFMELLVNDSMVELITDNITTHLTVCKYEDYQDVRNANETRKKHKRNSDEIQTNTIEEGKERKESKNIPPYSDFLDYAITKVPNVDKQHLKLKYEAWVVNGWKDGKDNEIKNWKSKLLQTLAHLPKIETSNQPQQQISYKTLL